MTKTESSTAPPRRRFLPRLLLGLATLLATLGVAELVARAALGDAFLYGAHRGRPQRILGEFDPELGWRNRPATRAWIVSGILDYEVTINRQGWRGREVDPVKRPGTTRIVLLGDSVAWGWGVDDDECFAELVDAALGDEVEVVNLSVPGYSTDQQLLQLEREGPRLQPDLVLLCCVMNDVQGNTRPKIYGMEKPWFRYGDGEWRIENQPVLPPAGAWERRLQFWFRRLRARSALFTTLSSDEVPPPRQDSMTPAELAAFRAERAERAPVLIREACASFADPQSVTYMLLGRIRDATRELGAELLVFDVPHLHDEYLYRPNRPAPDPPAEGVFRTFLSESIATAGRELDFATLSVDHALLESVRQGHVLHCGDGHLNARGNQLVAEVLIEALRPRLR